MTQFSKCLFSLASFLLPSCTHISSFEPQFIPRRCEDLLMEAWVFHEVTLCPSDPLHKLKQLRVPSRVEGEIVHSHTHYCRKLFLQLTLHLQTHPGSIVAICSVAHHEFGSSSWQTEVQGELCLNKLLLARPWWWLWSGTLASDICAHVCKHLPLLCRYSDVSRVLLIMVSWTESLLFFHLSVCLFKALLYL